MRLGIRVDLHRAELEAREPVHVEPESLLAEEDRPWRVPTHADGDVHEQGRGDDQRDSGDRHVERALHHEGRARQPRRRHDDEGHPLEQVHARTGPDQPEQSRHHVDDDVPVPQGADDVHRLVVRLLRERDDHAVDLMVRDELLELVEAAEHLDVTRLGSARERIRVDEPEKLESVFGMLANLACHELPDLARSEDDRPHRVRAGATCQRPRHGASDDDEADRQQPEDDETTQLRGRQVGHPRQRLEEPGAERDHDEHPDELVHGRVVGTFLVALVQPVELRQDEPHGQHEEEQEHLALGLHAVGRCRRRERRGREHEGRRDPDRVCDEKRAPDDPSTPTSRLDTLPSPRELRNELGGVHRRHADVTGLDDSHHSPFPLVPPPTGAPSTCS